ncbi:hypothetical protein NZK35_10485 [Stieleria sp. ICT_E10.1]|uniref:hypothetical protein n=1 Tax=Stieleria sedimenti TaxID=2976331 RepID=UPI00217F8251|nr:hypothetical protein [Stieleria sedimenti]MCS7467074.1 hypothetical protein [Stieleria sedimenti]
MNLPEKDREWFPKWLGSYASFPGVRAQTGSSEEIVVRRDLVIEFLQKLLAAKTPAWQRLQAVRAIEAYQGTVLQTSVVDCGHSYASP